MHEDLWTRDIMFFRERRLDCQGILHYERRFLLQSMGMLAASSFVTQPTPSSRSNRSWTEAT
jgi:hypothetical protein